MCWKCDLPRVEHDSCKIVDLHDLTALALQKADSTRTLRLSCKDVRSWELIFKDPKVYFIRVSAHGRGDGVVRNIILIVEWFCNKVANTLLKMLKWTCCIHSNRQ